MHYKTRPQIINFSLSAEHEISTASKYKKYKEFHFFSGSGKPRMLFFPLINVKNANNGWHFNIFERENFHAQLSLACFLVAKPSNVICINGARLLFIH